MGARSAVQRKIPQRGRQRSVDLGGDGGKRGRAPLSGTHGDSRLDARQGGRAGQGGGEEGGARRGGGKKGVRGEPGDGVGKGGQVAW